jgi:hypothetical protein
MPKVQGCKKGYLKFEGELKQMKRVKSLELKGASGSNLFKRLFVKGYRVTVGDKGYLTFATKMADACENVGKITKEYNIYENEKRYVKPADRKPGVQMLRPFWWYGRVYQIS